MKDLAISQLKERNLRVTIHRLSILCILMDDQTKAYSVPDLLKDLKEEMNASTIYRSLDKLVGAKIVLKKVDANGDALYIINLDNRCKHVAHPHLKCEDCGSLQCLPPFPADYASRLYDSGVQGLDVVLRGVCTNCAST